MCTYVNKCVYMYTYTYGYVTFKCIDKTRKIQQYTVSEVYKY